MAACEEADDDTILIKDGRGRIIGFEKLNVELVPGATVPAVEVVRFPEGEIRSGP